MSSSRVIELAEDGFTVPRSTSSCGGLADQINQLVAGSRNSIDLRLADIPDDAGGTGGGDTGGGGGDTGGSPGFDLDQHGLSGSWVNADTESQGFLLEIFPDRVGPGKPYVFAGWFTYDVTVAGGQRWYTVEGSGSGDNAELTIYGYHGGAFMSMQPVAREEVGTARLIVSDCTHASLVYDFPMVATVRYRWHVCWRTSTARRTATAERRAGNSCPAHGPMTSRR